jgi:DSF synthase
VAKLIIFIGGNMVFHSSAVSRASKTLPVNDTGPALAKPIADTSFNELIVRHDREDQILWCFMNQTGRPSYTYSIGEEVAEVQDWIRYNYALPADGGPGDLRYFVCGSKTPGVYNLGGDLRHFAECIRNRDRAAMQKYAETCVRMQYANANAFDAPIITMALVQGDALGGGFEHALAFDIIVAERSARMGLPEIMFNLFPGMGAYSFLSRRVSRSVTERLILDGKLYSAEELYEMGIVDILAEDGEGEQAIIEYCSKNGKRFEAERAVYRARRISAPVPLKELLDITTIWAETAMTLSDFDVRKMERLADAQERRLAKKIQLVV